MRIVLGWVARPDARTLRLEKWGSEMAGWVIPVDLFDHNAICYCAGVGEDISFDLALIERYGCTVFAFDPTPRAVSHVQHVARDNARYKFQGIGIWSSDATLRFYAPANPRHVSHSIVNLQRSSAYFEAPCRRLATIMHDLGHDHIDLLKLDIEGAEHAVVENLLDEQVPVRVICLEFDQPVRARIVLRTLRRLQRADYQLVNTDGWNYTFVKETAAVPVITDGRKATDVSTT